MGIMCSIAQLVRAGAVNPNVAGYGPVGDTISGPPDKAAIACSTGVGDKCFHGTVGQGARLLKSMLLVRALLGATGSG